MFLIPRHRAMIVCCLAVLSTFVGIEAKPGPKKPAAFDKKQIEFISVIVNGRGLAGPNTTARRTAGRITVPIAAIANSLGDSVALDANARTLTVTRQNGVVAILDLKLGQ